MKALLLVVAKTFPGLSYWTRLPGLVAFCGVAVGVCVARYCLAAVGVTDADIDASMYIGILGPAAFVFAAAGILCRSPALRAAFFAACGAALFAGGELALRDFYGKMEAAGERNQILTLTARITSPVATAYSGYKFRVKVIDADNAEIARILRGKTLSCVSRQTMPPYGVIKIQGRYVAPRRAAGPLGFDQREHFAVNNIHGSFTVSRTLHDDIDEMRSQTAGGSQSYNRLSPDNIFYALRTRVHGVIGKAASANARGIFHAAFLGEKEHLPADLSVLFRRSGIVHLLAISGFHAALLYSAVFAALGLFAVPPKVRTTLALSALWGYLFFIGFIPSLFRATVMVTFFCLSMALQRKNHAVHSLGMAGTLWLFMSPRSLFAPGFQLSFAATAGIIMMQPVLDMLTKGITARVRGAPVKFVVGKTLTPLWVSVAGFAATAPPLLHHFGTLSLYGIFFNLIAIPLMSAAMWAFFISIVLSPIDAMTSAAVWCAEKIIDALVYLAGFSARVAISEVVIPRTTAPELAAMTIFMAGLCCVRKDIRGAYAFKGGAAMSLVIAVSALYATMTAETEVSVFTRNTASATVVVHKDNTAWIAARGRAFDVKQLREREIEPFFARKKIRDVTLFVVGEEAEEEAHVFTFTTGHAPRIISVRKERPDRGGESSSTSENYAPMTAKQFISADGACTLSVNDEGGMDLRKKRPASH